MNLPISQPNSKPVSINDVLIDLYTENIEFCLEHKMSAEKISTFFSIMKEVHFQSMDPNVTVVDSFGLFTKQLVKHSVHHPPFSVEIFSQYDVKNMASYVHNTYYRHFKMYQYAFCPKQVAFVESRIAGDNVEVPFICKPLSESLPEGEYHENQSKLQEEKKKKTEEEQIIIQEQQKIIQQEEEEQEPKPLEQEEDNLDQPLHESAGEEPQLPHPYIQRQLNQIKEALSKMAESRLGEIEQKIAQIEEALQENKKERESKSREGAKKNTAAPKAKK